MHRLLNRQLRRVYGKTFDMDSLSPEQQQLIEIISKSYDQYDDEARFIEHSLDIYVEEIELAKKIAESANAAKGEFMANMSHEMRTPLHGILSFSALGKAKAKTDPREKLESFFSAIERSGERLNKLLSDLLDLTAMGSSRASFYIKKQDLIAVINTAVDELKNLYEKQSATVRIDVKAKNTSAYFDAEKIQQVLIYLMTNAVQYSPVNSSVAITVSDAVLPPLRSFNDTTPIPAVAVSVSDNGIGIPEDELLLIFEKFKQSSLTRTGAGGKGLGLAVCDEIITRQYGTIIAENNPDGGACFTFKLPRDVFLVMSD